VQYPRAVQRHEHIIELSAICLGKNAFDDIITMPSKWASTERQWFWAFHLGLSRGYTTTMIYNRAISRLSRQICLLQDRNHVPKWASTERQPFVRWHFGYSKRIRTQINHNKSIGSLYWQRCKWRYGFRLLQFSTHVASRLRTLHSNRLHYAVPKWSFTRSVVGICSCIQLHTYPCNVLLIWLSSL